MWCLVHNNNEYWKAKDLILLERRINLWASDGACRTHLEKGLVGFDQIANMVSGVCPEPHPSLKQEHLKTFFNEAESLQTFLHTWADKCGETSDLNPRGLRFKSSTIYFKTLLSIVMLHQYFSSDCRISADCLKPVWNAEHFTHLLFHK